MEDIVLLKIVGSTTTDEFVRVLRELATSIEQNGLMNDEYVENDLTIDITVK